MEVTIKVEGMSCNHCKMSVEKAAGTIGNVESPVVNLDAKELKFSFAGDESSTVASVKAAVKEAGFKPV